MAVKNGDKQPIESIYHIIIGIEIYMDKRNSNSLMPVFCFSSQFKMLMFENTKAQFKRKWKKNKTIHMNICYSGVILVSRVLQGIFIVTPLSLNLLFLKKVRTKVSFLYLNFPLTGIKESKILMKQQDFNRCTNITMKLLWHLIRNWML